MFDFACNTTPESAEAFDRCGNCERPLSPCGTCFDCKEGPAFEGPQPDDPPRRVSQLRAFTGPVPF